MQRIIWIGGVACIANVACIEEHAPVGNDLDAALADAGPDPDRGPRMTEPVDPGDPIEPEPGEPEPNEPEPEPELPPWICPPEGVFVFHVGACISDAGALPDPGRFEARITEIGEGIPVDGACGANGAQITLGRVGSDRARWFNAVTPDGRVWQILLDLPVDVRFAVDEVVVIDAQLGQADGWFGGATGSLAISTAEGLQAFVQAGHRGGPSLNDPELQLGRGAQSCYWEEPEDDFCTYTGHHLVAGDPRVDEVHALTYGQIVNVGPFQVINGGIMSIGDRGACNAPPEDFKVAAWRRK